VPETVRSESHEHDAHDHMHWHPTPEQFEAYIKREVEMAKVNLRKGIRAIDTLHSYGTVLLALADPDINLDRERVL
jgi:hypothetical protein